MAVASSGTELAANHCAYFSTASTTAAGWPKQESNDAS